MAPRHAGPVQSALAFSNFTFLIHTGWAVALVDYFWMWEGSVASKCVLLLGSWSGITSENHWLNIIHDQFERNKIRTAAFLVDATHRIRCIAERAAAILCRGFHLNRAMSRNLFCN